MIHSLRRLRSGLAVCALLAGSACTSANPEAFSDYSDNGGTVDTSCRTPNEGCPCDTDGQVIECGEVKEQLGTFVKCSMGKRECTNGRWAACQGDMLVTKSTTDSMLHFSALQDAGVACGSKNPCDPYCQVFAETPPSSVGDGGLTIADGGLTLSGSANGALCTGLTIAPTTAPASVKVTSFSPFTTSPAVTTFKATFTPAGCIPPDIQPTWTVDRPDLATIDANGGLNVFSGQAGLGLLKVQAFFAALTSNVVSVDVRVLVSQENGPSPNAAPTAAAAAKFYSDTAHTLPATPTAATNATWLYPYTNTYLPLGLPAPVLMYRMAANPGNTVKATLRYPAGSTATSSVFEYALVVNERSAVYPTSSPSTADPQIVIPQAVWQAFEQTAKGYDADLVIQRLVSNTLQNENVQRVHFVNGQLKGTVYYSSYSSPQGGNTGAILSIAPGATSPQLAVQPSGTCTVCHSIDVQGKRVISNFGASGNLDQARRWTLSGGYPSPPQTDSFTGTIGNRFTFGGPRGDGSLYLTAGYDGNWHAPGSSTASVFVNPSSPNTTISATNWPSNAGALTPHFSKDGSKIAFTYLNGTALPQTPSGTLASNSNGRTMVVVDFACNAGCTGSLAVTNARNVTPNVAQKIAWPSFTPDNATILYQYQTRTSKTVPDWSPVDVNTIGGALAEIWASNVPANKNTAAVPTRLNALNGLTAAGTSYLPEDARTVSPVPTAYHRAGSSFTVKTADGCGSATTVTNTSDAQLNYLPSVNPTEAGGFHWVVFTSRRMYGNIAYDNPWDAEPNTSCSSKTPPTKKLWVAAVDKGWTPGTDPSHPAFYLPGQELAAGNANATWVDEPCGAVGAGCSTDSDCCQSPQAEACRIDLPVQASGVTRKCQLKSACVSVGSSCTTDADCCGNPTIKCVGTGNKVCAASQAYAGATYTRDYDSACPTGTRVVWQSFAWQAIVPAGSSIDFKAQTGSSTSTLGAAVGVGSATSTAATWTTGSQTVDQALRAANPAQQSQSLLRVSMTLNTNGLVAPTLTNWQQFYDCVPSE